MISEVIKSTQEYLQSMPKTERKKIGQFFTSEEIAKYMANLFELNNLPESISILDPGAGSGILSTALLDRIETIKTIKKVELVCYENNESVLPILKKNMEILKKRYSFELNYKIREIDYIVSQANDFEGTLLAKKRPKKYHIVVGNPPYLRVMRDNVAALAMPSVVHGAPNLYFLFAAMSLFNLKKYGEMVYIIPRSWTSGAYFREFRRYLFTYGKINNIHLFVSRDKVFDQESVLQETIIIKITKTDITPEMVHITSTNTSSDFNKVSSIDVPYDEVVVGNEQYVFLPTSIDEIDTIRMMNRYSTTLPEEGIRMRTGIVVDFRQRNELRKEKGRGIVPLFYGQHIKNGRVNHGESGKECEWIIDSKPRLIQKNKNYVFCKRFTAKEESRRLQCGIYEPKNYSEYDYIGTQNKINYVDRLDGSEMSVEETYGVFVLLNSTVFDNYYRILNGSTQVNSTEVNNMPVPPIALIRKMGKCLIESGDLSTNNCDRILKEVAYG